MRRFLPIWLLSVFLISLGAGCGKGGADGPDSGTDGSDAGTDGLDAGSDGSDGGGGGDIVTRTCPDEGYIVPVVGENVGHPSSIQLTELTPNSGEIHEITVDGTVIDGKLINGCVVIAADNVTIRNTHIRCTTQNMQGEPYVGGINVRSTASNALIEHCTIECYGASEDQENCRYGINGGNLTARFNNVFGCSDGFDVFANSVYECNYVHHLPLRPIGYHPDGYTHNDGVQGFAGHIEIRGNYFEGNTNDNGQGIFFQSETFSNEPIDAVIENNYLTGFWINVIQCNLKGGMEPVECRVDNNVIRDDEVNLQSDGSRWLTIGIQNGATGSASCNRWGDGTFIPDNLVKGVTHQTSNCN